LGQAAFVKVELWTDDDNGTTGIVDAFTEQVLTEPALFALEHVAKGFQRTVVVSLGRACAAAVVKQGVDSFLQHAFFVTQDDLGGLEFHELFKAVVTVDYTTIEIIEI